MSLPTPELLRDLIAAGLECTHLEVQGDGQHFYATIVSPRFTGLTRIARHRLVYEVLGERMREQVHALSMRTIAPGEP
ncbi:BolA/IbaG family iron-sulfur metabolism protein, partial [Metallibacterium scheffleri]|uniref:BolA family protein n=1 Tax=Metallibacterium scheffleri TaxID=993689 RepID=UPI0026F0CA40